MNASNPAPFGAGDPESGMTLLEILVVVTILVIIAFPIASVLTIGLIIPSQEQQRLSDTGDAQLLQSFLVNDVQEASMVTTTSVTGACNNAMTLLQLQWTDQATTSTTVTNTVDYAQPSGSATVVRYFCGSDGRSSQVTVLTSYKTGTWTNTTPPACLTTLSVVAAAIPALCVSVTEKGTRSDFQPYTFTLSATRRDS